MRNSWTETRDGTRLKTPMSHLDPTSGCQVTPLVTRYHDTSIPDPMAPFRLLRVDWVLSPTRFEGPSTLQTQDFLLDLDRQLPTSSTPFLKDRVLHRTRFGTYTLSRPHPLLKWRSLSPPLPRSVEDWVLFGGPTSTPPFKECRTNKQSLNLYSQNSSNLTYQVYFNIIIDWHLKEIDVSSKVIGTRLLWVRWSRGSTKRPGPGPGEIFPICLVLPEARCHSFSLFRSQMDGHTGADTHRSTWGFDLHNKYGDEKTLTPLNSELL